MSDENTDGLPIKSESPKVLDQLGPYLKHDPVKIGCYLSQFAYERYHRIVGNPVAPSGMLHEQTPPRMMYIAEAVSTGLRLNATWGLSFPAMSLVRDRYEQAARFSWLTRMNDPWQWKQYAATYYTKWRKLYGDMNPAQRAEFDKMTPVPPGWMTEPATKEDRKAFERYQSMSLLDMVKQRDALPPVGTLALDREPLADLYSSVYVHYSSVTHYDFYAVRLLALHRNPAGEHVLAVDPFWPAMLVLNNALFDIIQCREATAPKCSTEDEAAFSEFHSIWDDTVHRQGLSKEEFEKALREGKPQQPSLGNGGGRMLDV